MKLSVYKGDGFFFIKTQSKIKELSFYKEESIISLIHTPFSTLHAPSIHILTL